MTEGILYNVFKTGDDISGMIAELNFSADTARIYNYPKCLLVSSRLNDIERGLIKMENFDLVIEYDQPYVSMTDKLCALTMTPFDRTIMVDSDVIFLNAESYNIIQNPNPNRPFEYPKFCLKHLFAQTFAMCSDTWCFKTPVRERQVYRNHYCADLFEVLYRKYGHRENIFTYNASIMAFDRRDDRVMNLVHEAHENAAHIRDVRKNSMPYVTSGSDQVCLSFAIENQQFFPSYIHHTFGQSLFVRDSRIYAHSAIIMSHTPEVIGYCVKNDIKLV